MSFNKMPLFFYLISSLPGMIFSLGVGGVPIRYVSIFLLFNYLRISKKDLPLLVLITISLIYPLMALYFRPFHLLDISYFLSFVYLLLGVTIVRKKPQFFKRFLIFFWGANAVYSVLQNVIINVMAGDSSLALLHLNSHSPDYEVPPSGYFPYLYRVTGLFVESAPFVVYLMFTHFAFVTMGVKRLYIFLNVAFIFFSGAKTGFLFLAILLIIKMPFVRRLNFFYCISFVCLFIAVLGDVLLIFISEYVGYGLHSIYIRLDWFVVTLNEFEKTVQGLFFGGGYVSTHQLMFDDSLGFHRGIDFFSTFIFSNGVVGSLLMLSPIWYWFAKNHYWMRCDLNLFVASLFIALMTVGSIINFQYAYLFFIVAYLSEWKGCEKNE